MRLPASDLRTVVLEALGHRDLQRAMTEAEFRKHLAARRGGAERELLQDVLADDPELADAVADEGRDVVVADEHQLGGEIADAGGQAVLAAFDPKSGIAQQIAARIREAARLLQSDVEARAISEHCRRPKRRLRRDIPDALPAGGSVRRGRSSSC